VTAAPSSDLTLRRLAGIDELELFLSLSYSLDHELTEDLASGRRRPEWMWIALGSGRLVGRVAWWGAPGDTEPAVLDFLDVAEVPDRIEVGVELLTKALAAVIQPPGTPPDYLRFVPSDWRDHEDSRRIVEDRMAIAGRAGARFLVERLRLEWRPGTPVQGSTGLS
jgi:hypothetical protein